jgi:hypothetical protein
MKCYYSYYGNIGVLALITALMLSMWRNERGRISGLTWTHACSFIINNFPWSSLQDEYFLCVSAFTTESCLEETRRRKGWPFWTIHIRIIIYGLINFDAIVNLNYLIQPINNNTGEGVQYILIFFFFFFYFYHLDRLGWLACSHSELILKL